MKGYREADGSSQIPPWVPVPDQDQPRQKSKAKNGWRNFKYRAKNFFGGVLVVTIVVLFVAAIVFLTCGIPYLLCLETGRSNAECAYQTCQGAGSHSDHHH